MKKVTDAVACFARGFSCAQAIFSTYSLQLGLDKETSLKISSAFGGGIGRTGHICGALTGAFMVLGLKYGRKNLEDTESKERTYELVNKFINRFKAQNQNIICKELLGYELNSPEGRQLIQKETRCLKFVKDAAEILEQML